MHRLKILQYYSRLHVRRNRSTDSCPTLFDALLRLHATCGMIFLMRIDVRKPAILFSAGTGIAFAIDGAQTT